MPRATYRMAAAHFNSTIFLLGGEFTQSQMVEFDTANDQFIDYGTNFFVNGDIHGQGQFYTQHGSELFIIPEDSDSISMFDLRSKELTHDWMDISLLINVQSRACITSSADYLAILGGRISSSPTNAVQVLDFETLLWIADVPTMRSPRLDLTCEYHAPSDKLVAIGGYGSGHLSSVERLDGDLSGSWEYTESLSASASRLSSVVRGDVILVVGGSAGTTSTYRDTVHVIDPATGSVAVYPETLPYGVDGLSPIIVGDILFWFGGRIAVEGSTHITDHWATHSLPALSTTASPSSDRLYVDIGRRSRNKRRYVCDRLESDSAAAAVTNYKLKDAVIAVLCVMNVILLVAVWNSSSKGYPAQKYESA